MRLSDLKDRDLLYNKPYMLIDTAINCPLIRGLMSQVERDIRDIIKSEFTRNDFFEVYRLILFEIGFKLF